MTQRQNFYERIFGKPNQVRETNPTIKKATNEQRKKNKGFVLQNLPEIILDSPEDYILIPQKSQVISKTQDYNDLEWQEAIEQLQEHNLILPRIDVFTQHFLNLREASQGNLTLYNAKGEPIEIDEAEHLWNYISSTNREPHNNKDFWIWLDAHFQETDGKLYLQTNHKFKNQTLTNDRFELEDCLKEDSHVNLNFNQQGLPQSTSPHEDYIQGENIHYFQLENERVAGFYTSSNWAYLSCGWNPRSSDSRLGIIFCAKGTNSKK